jgi:CheY-like chemotaxis protein
MPNIDGLTMVEKVRKELNNPTVQIIMLTTENAPAMKERPGRRREGLDRQALQRRGGHRVDQEAGGRGLTLPARACCQAGTLGACPT